MIKACLIVVCFAAFFSFCLSLQTTTLAQKDASLTANGYEEELLITPLSIGDKRSTFLTEFKFRFLASLGKENSYPLFPKALGFILKRFSVDELHLHFTQGHWSSDKWGSEIQRRQQQQPDPTHFSFASAPFGSYTRPPGVELWAYFAEQEASEDQEGQWKGLKSALSALTCASLDTIGPDQTTYPLHTFLPESNRTLSAGEGKSVMRYAASQLEALCTENLTPMLKLLPCYHYEGIASLLQPQLLFSTEYHTMGMDVVKQCTGGEGGGGFEGMLQYALEVNVAMVIQHYHEQPLPTGWDAKLIFTQEAEHVQPCAVSDRSEIVVKPETMTKNNSDTQIYVERYVVSSSSFGSLGGEVRVEIHNPSPSAHLQSHFLDAVYFDWLPGHLRPLFHTLRIYSVNAAGMKEVAEGRVIVGGKEGGAKEKASKVEIVGLRLEANKVYHIQYSFQFNFLHVDDFTPDPNYGLPSGYGVLSILNTSSTSSSSSNFSPFRVYSSVVNTVVLPLPDFSMPYNVISLTCTAVVYFFGGVIIALVKKRDQDSSISEQHKKVSTDEGEGEVEYELDGPMKPLSAGALLFHRVSDYLLKDIKE